MSKYDPRTSLAAKCNQPVILDVGGYKLRPYDGWNLWLENPAGEGCTIRKAHMLKVLHDLFKREF